MLDIQVFVVVLMDQKVEAPIDSVLLHEPDFSTLQLLQYLLLIVISLLLQYAALFSI